VRAQDVPHVIAPFTYAAKPEIEPKGHIGDPEQRVVR
jgi:hypothetical protein